MKEINWVFKMEEEGKRQSAQSIQQSPSGAGGTSAMVPGARMNSAEKYNQSTDTANYVSVRGCYRKQ